MRNKYLCRAHVLERDFRTVLRCFAHDVSALTAAKMCGVNKNTTHRIYGLLWQGVGALAVKEIPLIGLLKRAGKVFTQIVLHCSYSTGMAGRRVTPGVYGFKHHRVYHSGNEFARGRRHINGIESFWSFVKVRLAKQRGICTANFISTSKNPNGAGIIAVIASTNSY